MGRLQHVKSFIFATHVAVGCLTLILILDVFSPYREVGVLFRALLSNRTFCNDGNVAVCGGAGFYWLVELTVSLSGIL